MALRRALTALVIKRVLSQLPTLPRPKTQWFELKRRAVEWWRTRKSGG